MAVHESQSRLWENIIGRSREFWAYFLPRLQQCCPEQLAEVTVEQVYQAVNVVRPDFIRVEADELTYNLHIFLRFELETVLIANEIEVKDLALALTEADDVIDKKIRSNISERAAQTLDEEASLMSAPTKEDINNAREKTVDILRGKNQSGELAFVEEE